ncbi:MAG: ABC transporter ATP-binding protein [Candidatus Hydrogenedentota bacterium]
MRLTLRNLSKHFHRGRRGVQAVEDVSFEVNDGEFFILLGPSGCGKSTILNLVAGLEKPTSGEILFDEEPVAAPAKRLFVPTKERDVAMVFQSYALYPHMRVFDNIAFPLRIAKEKKKTIKEAVYKTAEMLGIEALLDRKPGELSGGQRQWVAISRALVRRPKIFLLDEPLSNLDAQLRTAMRAELKQLQNEIGVTTLYVTHDQVEALTMGDRVALLREGQLVQVDTPLDLYDCPKSPFAAEFMGSPPMNLMEAQLTRSGETFTVIVDDTSYTVPEPEKACFGAIEEGPVLLGIRPQHIAMYRENGQGLRGRVKTVEPLGREVLFHVDVSGKDILVLREDAAFHENDAVQLEFDPERIRVYEASRESL